MRISFTPSAAGLPDRGRNAGRRSCAAIHHSKGLIMTKPSGLATARLLTIDDTADYLGISAQSVHVGSGNACEPWDGTTSGHAQSS
jgi:hypothetical protein